MRVLSVLLCTTISFQDLSEMLRIDWYPTSCQRVNGFMAILGKGLGPLSDSVVQSDQLLCETSGADWSNWSWINDFIGPLLWFPIVSSCNWVTKWIGALKYWGLTRNPAIKGLMDSWHIWVNYWESSRNKATKGSVNSCSEPKGPLTESERERERERERAVSYTHLTLPTTAEV